MDFEFEKLALRIDELAYLNPGLTIHLIDKRSKAMRDRHNLVKSSSGEEEVESKQKGKIVLIKEDANDLELEKDEPMIAERAEVYRHDGGIKELVAVLCEGKTNLHPDVDIITVAEERKGVMVEAAMRWLVPR